MELLINKYLNLFAVLAVGIFFPVMVVAAPGYFELSGGFGVLYSQLGSNTVRVTTTEIDTIHQTSNPLVGDGNIGLGYVIPLLTQSNQNSLRFFSSIKPAVNFRYVDRDTVGDVYQYQQANLANYIYDLSLTSRRLMLDLTLALIEYQHFSIHAVAGMGEAWTQVAYNDTPLLEVQGGSLSLNNRTNAGFVAEIGAGVGYEINSRFSVALDYLYANYGSVKTASTGTLNGAAEIIHPMTFPLRTQEVLFEVNMKL